MGHRAEGFQLDLPFRQRVLVGVDRAKHCYLQIEVVMSKWRREMTTGSYPDATSMRQHCLIMTPALPNSLLSPYFRADHLDGLALAKTFHHFAQDLHGRSGTAAGRD